MMSPRERIDALSALGEYLAAPSSADALSAVISLARAENGWFTEENVRIAINAIRHSFLDDGRLREWLNGYPPILNPSPPLMVGLVMAGNIPLVGFHDLLCTFVAGHVAQIKCSDKDKVLLPFLLQALADIDDRTKPFFSITDRLSGFDAVIATGSDNSARYFESYFSPYPHIIRRNRNAVAVLSGEESDESLAALAHDVFLYFGLGCRNVSMLYVPKGYDFQRLLDAFAAHRHVLNHHHYRNNFDYNLTLMLLNAEPHIQGESILLAQAEGLQSRIGTLHYQEWDATESLLKLLQLNESRIQCVVSETELAGVRVVPFGEAQSPGLSDYPDGVDTLQFLLDIHQT